MHISNKRILGLTLAFVLVVLSFPAATLCAPSNVLTVGHSGDGVYEVQKKLNELGYLQTSPTGYYGSQTKAAVTAFQTDSGLSVDGLAGPATQQALIGRVLETPLNEVASKGSAPQAQSLGVQSTQNVAVTTKSNDQVILSNAPIVAQSPVYTDPNLMKIGSRGESVSKLQQRLKDLGYYTQAAVTGYYGNVTATAVRSFQASNDLTADGIAGSKTLAKVYSNTAAKATNTGNTGSATASPGGNKTVELAKQHLGKPYLWGGNGPNSFDCSGFVHYILKQQGFKGERMSANSQSNYAAWKLVDYKNMVAGDLMFFDTRKDGSVPIGHVGIYMGNGQMIHASSSAGKIVISQVTSGYYKEQFRRARRVFY